jgi:hypothetical protein
MSNVGFIWTEGELKKTLLDVLPDNGPLKLLIIGKTPAPVSVETSHYFQGRSGKKFWNLLKKYHILKDTESLSLPPDTFEDDILSLQNYGITDIVKDSHEPGSEPLKHEYLSGWARVETIIETHKPEIILFPYKGALDKILRFQYERKEKAEYGFNQDLESIFGRKVFAMPLPGVGGVTSEEIDRYMMDLQRELQSG